MATLDQRILIPATSERVWAFLRDMANNPLWQADCDSVSFLTSTRDQVGLRWRSASKSGRAVVLEITSWYDRLGYEYTYVDGMPFRESRGRFRLQEIPEGTIVQWSLTYELGGLMPGVRDALGLRRRLERDMIDSLRALWREITRAGASEPGTQAKSLMRDAPDVEARSQYQPRHPSAVQRPVAPSASPVIQEPPISEDDTRPRLAATAPTPAPAAPAPPPKPMEEPDFLVGMTDFDQRPAVPLVVETDDIFRRPAQIEPKPGTAEEEPGIEPKPVAAEESPAIKTESFPAEKEPTAKREAVMRPSTLPELEPPPRMHGLDEPVPPIDSTKLDTTQISVFDVFGLPKPSETQELEAINSTRATEIDPESPRFTAKVTKSTLATSTAEIQRAAMQRRIGLRAAMRRNVTRLRHS